MPANNRSRSLVPRNNASRATNSQLGYAYPGFNLPPQRINWDNVPHAPFPRAIAAIENTQQGRIEAPESSNNDPVSNLASDNEAEPTLEDFLSSWESQRAYLEPAFENLVMELETAPDAADYAEDFKPLLNALRRVYYFLARNEKEPRKEVLQPVMLPLLRVLRTMLCGNGESHDSNADYDSNEDMFDIADKLQLAKNPLENWGVVRMPSRRIHQSRRYVSDESRGQDDNSPDLDYPGQIASLTFVPLHSLIEWVRGSKSSNSK